MREGTIAGVIVLPTPWPPSRSVQLFTQDAGGSRVQLSADSVGRLTVSFNSGDATIRRYTFQRIQVEGSGRAIFIVTWSESGATVRLNGQETMLDTDASGEPFLLKTSSDPLKIGPLFPGLNPSVGHSEAEYLFLSTIVDVDQKIMERSRYSLIRVAGLLRQLFLDATPLVYEVNRNYRLKLQFECIEYQSVSPGSPNAHWRNPDHSQFPNAKTTIVDLDTFLKVPCLEVNGRTASIGDLIRASANAKGGVHLGKAKATEEEIILDWDKVMLLLGEEPSLLAIAGVCRVALSGLRPLVHAIAGRPA